MAITKHFQLVKPEAVQRRVFIPGFGSPVIKRLFNTPLRLVQTGYATSDELAALEADLRDPTVTTTVDALNLGNTYTDMYKADLEATGEMTGGDDRVFNYKLTWEQVCYS